MDAFTRDIQAKLAESQEMLEGLLSGNLYLGSPYEGRTEAKIAHLRRDIARYELLLKRNA